MAEKETETTAPVAPARVARAAPTPPAVQAPALGRTVHYVIGSGPNEGQHRAAVVTHVVDDTTVNLTVHADSARDFHPWIEGDTGQHTFRAPHATYDAEGKRGGSWHWPERV